MTKPRQDKYSKHTQDYVSTLEINTGNAYIFSLLPFDVTVMLYELQLIKNIYGMRQHID